MSSSRLVTTPWICARPQRPAQAAGLPPTGWRRARPPSPTSGRSAVRRPNRRRRPCPPGTPAGTRKRSSVPVAGGTGRAIVGPCPRRRAAPRSRALRCAASVTSGQRLALGDPELQLDQIEARAPARSPGARPAAGRSPPGRRSAAGVEQELDGARAHVADRLARGDGRGGKLRRAARRRRPAKGDSSMIFWWRRWTEQSRSNRCDDGRRACRRGSAPRRGAGARRSARGTPCRRRTPTPPRLRAPRPRLVELGGVDARSASRGRRRRPPP